MDDKNTIFYKELTNKKYYAKEDEDVYYYAKGVVNPGESYIGTSLDDSSAWTDWSDIAVELRTMNVGLNDDSFEYDNLPIRSYPQTEPLTIFNLNTEPEKESYKAGDKLKGIILVENNSKVDYTEDYFDLQLAVSIGNKIKAIPHK